MTDEEIMLGKLYDGIADKLNISKTMREKAISSYNAVGVWLCKSEEIGEVEIYPQGSFSLGTVIKPISDKDDYDIDLVCLLEDGIDWDERKVKTLVGKRLKESELYKQKLEEEGKRCWTMNYDEFHMDILPCTDRYSYQRILHDTQIRLTHKTGPNTYEPRYSNPKEYHKWFEKRMESILNEERKSYAFSYQVNIDDVQTYDVRTPLQKAIQLLKRHRDIMFDGKDNAPISIIITTLAALSYDNETNVYEALKNILLNMSLHILVDENGNYIIKNPVMKDENFADKWNAEPEKKNAFFQWLKQAKADIIDNPLSVKGLNHVAQYMKTAFGTKLTESVITDFGEGVSASRASGNLYSIGLTGGLSTKEVNGAQKVEGHSFYGQ